jgi:nucleoside-diphosphate-sugar epimerase
MKILITGGLGFVGANLSDYLLDKGHAVIAVGRAATQERITADRYQYISADTTRPGDWQKALDDVDAVVLWLIWSANQFLSAGAKDIRNRYTTVAF